MSEAIADAKNAPRSIASQMRLQTARGFHYSYVGTDTTVAALGATIDNLMERLRAACEQGCVGAEGPVVLVYTAGVPRLCRVLAPAGRPGSGACRRQPPRRPVWRAVLRHPSLCAGQRDRRLRRLPGVPLRARACSGGERADHAARWREAAHDRRGSLGGRAGGTPPCRLLLRRRPLWPLCSYRAGRAGRASSRSRGSCNDDS